MTNRTIALGVLVLLATSATTAFALSRELHEPEVFWPKGFDEKAAHAVTAVLKDARFKFKSGLISYWEPKFETTLAYDGDTSSLNAFVAALAKVNGVNVKVTFAKDLSKETHGYPPAGAWWVQYAHDAPNDVIVRVNLADPKLDIEKLELPPVRG
jgi:hypothetical protein